jgi:hypothetical protein
MTMSEKRAWPKKAIRVTNGEGEADASFLGLAFLRL